LRAKVSDGVDCQKSTQGQSKWEPGARNFIGLRNAKAAPATVNICRYQPDTSLNKLQIHDVAEGNIGGNSVSLLLRIFPSSPPSFGN
jgi:hypothetical protein